MRFVQWMLLLSVVSKLVTAKTCNPEHGKYTEEEGRKFMENFNKEGEIWAARIYNSEWDLDSNLSDYNLQKQLEVSSQFAAYYKEQVKELNKYPWKEFKDRCLKRQFQFSAELGKAALPEERLSRFDEVVATMSDIYGTTKLLEWQSPGSEGCNNRKTPTMSLEPDVEEIFLGQDTCKMLYYWEGWHSVVGRAEKCLFEEYAQLNNEAARLNNFTDAVEWWNNDMEVEDFDSEIHKTYLEILPFYQELYAYVRRRLAEHYNCGEQKLIDEQGCLPAHLLGNVWAQEWQNLYNQTVPFPGKSSVDVTSSMKAKNFTPLKMVQMAEEFYTSINLSAMTETFWKKSIFEKPTDRKMVCHASAWEFSTGDDYRIKMCTRINTEDFNTIHHEMGHIEYYMLYRSQPHVFRKGANEGFHEAIGDTIALSVSTAQHLITVGLLDPQTYVEDKESELNSLYLMALEKVTFLPYAYVLDLWRWEIFRGNITSKQYNCRFWQLRQEIQGVVPPVDRSTKDFDGGAKYHVIGDISYARYFVAFIIQFQFHKALCIKAGKYNPEDPASKPLHHCDIYRSEEAGNLLSEVLRLGKSKPPQEAMKLITGQEDMDAGPLLEYFKPLYDWLVEENKRSGAKPGWAECKIDCTSNGRVKVERKDKSGSNACRYPLPKKYKKNKKKKEREKQTGNECVSR